MTLEIEENIDVNTIIKLNFFKLIFNYSGFGD